MAQQNTRVTMTTPRGTFIWPRLNTPDTKFDAAGKYNSKIGLDANDPAVQAFVARLEKVRDDFYDATVAALRADKKAGLAAQITKAPVITVELDPETGAETGRLIFNASMKASGISKKTGKPWTMKPDIIDATARVIQNPPQIYGGTEGKLSVGVDAFLDNANKIIKVSAQLNAAQILKLVSGGQRDASSYGFAAEEGDEIADGVAQQSPFEPDTSADGAVTHADL